MEQKQPKILVFTVASWNSRVGANTWASLLRNYDSANVANVCLREEVPDSDVCSRYFCISENRIIKSLFKRSIATGYEMEKQAPTVVSADLAAHNDRYRRMQKKRRYSMLLARELIWKLGRWHTPELDAFLDDFKPDIILHSMEGYIHLNRIIQHAVKRTGAKAVGYIWDDNFTYKQSTALGYKIYRYFQRRSLKRLARCTKAFFAISDMTKREADAFFGVECEVLTKPLSARPEVDYSALHTPMRMLYTGNLMIGRDRSLARIVEALDEINRDEIKFTVDVYTKTVLGEEMAARLNTAFCTIHPPIPQQEVLEKQRQADILLFLEDIDGPDAHVARLSFSTKTTDYLSSGKCIFAVGCEDTAPMQYFIDSGAAVTAVTPAQIGEGLRRIAQDPSMLERYAIAAAQVGIERHSREQIQAVFDRVMASVLDLT